MLPPAPSMKKSIPPELHAYVLKLYGDGKTGEEIGELLWREHKVEVSSRAVQRLLRNYRSERADIAKTEIRGRLQKELAANLDSLEDSHSGTIQLQRRALRISRQLREIHPQHPEAFKWEALALKAFLGRARFVNLVLHYSGAGEPDQPPLLGKPQKDALLQRLERLIGAETAPEPAPGPKDEPPVH